MHGRDLLRPLYVRPRSQGGILTLAVRVTDVAQPEGGIPIRFRDKCRP